MGSKYLIDTSVIIKYLTGSYKDDVLDKLQEILSDEFFISFITKIELLAFNSNNSTDQRLRQEIIDMATISYLNDDIINTCINIRKEKKIKIPDALIASTAITQDLSLISSNFHDFTKVVPLGLKFLNPDSDLK